MVLNSLNDRLDSTVEIYRDFRFYLNWQPDNLMLAGINIWKTFSKPFHADVLFCCLREKN